MAQEAWPTQFSAVWLTCGLTRWETLSFCHQPWGDLLQRKAQKATGPFPTSLPVLQRWVMDPN